MLLDRTPVFESRAPHDAHGWFIRTMVSTATSGFNPLFSTHITLSASDTFRNVPNNAADWECQARSSNTGVFSKYAAGARHARPGCGQRGRLAQGTLRSGGAGVDARTAAQNRADRCRKCR
jgi:hypothetical protein